ncbi:hypothetical protein ACLB2K_025058 [Fragaria x ananassa]
MVCSQPTQDTDSAPSMEQVFQTFAQLTGQIQSLTTHVTDLAGKVDDLAEQAKRNKIQQTQQKLGQTTNVLHKKIALPSSLMVKDFL